MATDLRSARRRHPAGRDLPRPGDIYDLPGDDDTGWGACRALLWETDVADANGANRVAGVHDWWIIASNTLATGVVTTIDITGGTYVGRDAALLVHLRAQHDPVESLLCDEPAQDDTDLVPLLEQSVAIAQAARRQRHPEDAA
ncbi:MAG TPA: hypothetical protein VHK88_19955 [Aquihabitans sp.]|jgi:hypothetical protein|nr:hypothetical protein [Aquihabitans sp.]